MKCSIRIKWKAHRLPMNERMIGNWPTLWNYFMHTKFNRIVKPKTLLYNYPQRFCSSASLAGPESGWVAKDVRAVFSQRWSGWAAGWVHPDRRDEINAIINKLETKNKTNINILTLDWLSGASDNIFLITSTFSWRRFFSSGDISGA